jgi:hypothetical protein
MIYFIFLKIVYLKKQKNKNFKKYFSFNKKINFISLNRTI